MLLSSMSIMADSSSFWWDGGFSEMLECQKEGKTEPTNTDENEDKPEETEKKEKEEKEEKEETEKNRYRQSLTPASVESRSAQLLSQSVFYIIHLPQSLLAHDLETPPPEV